MPLKPTSGQVALFKMQMGTASSYTNVPAVNWTFDADGKLADVSNFRDGRGKAGTCPDGTVSCTLVWDASTNPTLAANGGIQLGAQGMLELYTDNTTTNFWGVPVTLGTISKKNDGVESVLMMDVTFGLNGTFTYPVG